MENLENQLNVLTTEEVVLTEKYANLLKSMMQERGLNEHLAVPKDSDGDLMGEPSYEEITGEWTSNPFLLSDSVIARFGIIENKLCYHTSPYQKYYYGREERDSPWIPVVESPNLETIRKCTKYCIEAEFPWKFTATHPGCRFLPFSIDFRKYIDSIKSYNTMDYLLAGFHEMKEMNLQVLSGVKHSSIKGMFSGCYALETIDLSGFILSSGGIVGPRHDIDVFAHCNSLKTIILRNCNRYTVEGFKGAIQINPTPLSVTLTTDFGDINVNNRK